MRGYFEKCRSRMVEIQLRGRGIRNERILEAFMQVERHLFVRPEDSEFAYSDYPLDIGFGQTISQPYMVASMLEVLDPQPDSRVLEIGAGSGYSAAILSLLAESVLSLERVPELARAASERLATLGYDNVQVSCGDGSLGSKTLAPFDRIVIAAAAPEVPQSLKMQLAPEGILVAPVGGRDRQALTRVTRLPNGGFEVKTGFECRFVPLIGEEGWKDDGTRAD